jgi:K+-transporting ATPase ATPase B chain
MQRDTGDSGCLYQTKGQSLARIYASTVGLRSLWARLAPGAAWAPAAALRHGAVPVDTRVALKNGTTKLARDLAKSDVVVLAAGDVIPADGIILEGMAWVEKSAITGESAPVIRESGTDRNTVTGGSHIISDRVVVEII